MTKLEFRQPADEIPEELETTRAGAEYAVRELAWLSLAIEAYADDAQRPWAEPKRLENQRMLEELKRRYDLGMDLIDHFVSAKLGEFINWEVIVEKEKADLMPEVDEERGLAA